MLIGTVRDAATKKPLADVMVSVTSPSLQGEQAVATDASGQYRIPNLPPGSYKIVFEAGGHRPHSRQEVALRTSSTLRCNADLLPEGIEAPVLEIVATPPAVDVVSSHTAVTVDREFMNRLALLAPSGKGAVSRSFESLAVVAPGAGFDRYGVSLSGTTSPENQYVIDGLSVNNPAFAVVGTPLAADFVSHLALIEPSAIRPRVKNPG